MIPRTYPSTINASTGLRQMVVYLLDSVAGLQRWTDYIPVKWASATTYEASTNVNGFLAVDPLSSTTGKTKWVDYVPCYVDNAATDAWQTSAVGMLPISYSGGLYPGDTSALQTLVRAGGVTAVNPLTAIGDSHTDNTTSAHFMWDQLKTTYNQPGEGLAGVPSGGIVPLGNNGQTLANYLAGGGTNTFTAAMATAPAVVVPCWLTNDVRLGGLGLTVQAIADAGSALLNQHVTNIKASRPSAKIILRVPAPYLTVNVGSLNYITDGSTVNPAGLAQIYTTGVRQAYYKVRQTYPDVLVYDPQARLFGTTSPTTVGTYFADQIHQSQAGYEAEAKDFADFVNAAALYSQTTTDAALVSQPYTPWLAYNRAVEDTDRFVKVADAYAVTVTAANTFLDFGPSSPNALPTSITAYDIVAPTASGASFMLPSGSSATTSGANTRLLGVGPVPSSAAARTHTRVYRQTKSGDSALNAVMAGSLTYLRTGRISAGAVSFMDIKESSLSAALATQTANLWVPEMKAGDKVYVEGFGGSPLTLTTNYAASGGNLRVIGLAGTDWSLYVGRIVIVTRA